MYLKLLLVCILCYFNTVDSINLQTTPSTDLYIYSFGLSNQNNYNISIIDVSNGDTIKTFSDLPTYDILGISNDNENNLIILGQQEDNSYTLAKLVSGDLQNISSMMAEPKELTYLTSSFAYYPDLGNTAVLLSLPGKSKVSLAIFNFTENTLKMIDFKDITQDMNPISSGSTDDNYYIQYYSLDGSKQYLLVYSLTQQKVLSTYTISNMPSQIFIQLFVYNSDAYGLTAGPGVLTLYQVKTTGTNTATAKQIIKLDDIVWNYYMNFLLFNYNSNVGFVTFFTYPTKSLMTLTTLNLQTFQTVTINSTNVAWNENPISYLVIENSNN